MKKKQEGVSVRTMTIAVMVFILLFCWGIAASAYFGAIIDPGAAEGTGGAGEALWFGLSGLATFFGNFIRIDAAPAIITHTFKNRIGIVWLLGVLEVLAVGFGLMVHQLERKLEPVPAGPKRRRKKRRRPRPTGESA